jgi:hypothetical protein
MANRIMSVAQTLVVMMVLTACGTNPTNQSSANTAAPSSRVTDTPAQAAAPTTMPSVAVVTPSVATAAPSAAQRSPYADIEQGRTPEGYHVLGSANAPVTLVMYSDFF